MASAYVYLLPKKIFFKTRGHFAKNRSSRPGVFCKKSVLENFAKFTGKQLCQNLFVNKVVGFRPNKESLFINKETLAQVFSCEFCQIFKNTFFHRTPPVAVSERTSLHWKKLLSKTVLNIHNFFDYIFEFWL